MGRKKTNVEARAVNDVDSIDDTVGYSGESVGGEVIPGLGQEDMQIAEELGIDETPCNSVSEKARERLETKKRLDTYLERQMLKESGWDEDDELFDDEFFSDAHRHRA